MDITVLGRPIKLTLSGNFYYGSLKTSGITILVHCMTREAPGRYQVLAGMRDRQDQLVAETFGNGPTLEAAEQDLKKRLAERAEAYRVMQAELG